MQLLISSYTLQALMVTKNIPPSLTEILLLSAKSYNWNVGFLEVSCKVYAATVDICGGVGLVRRIFVANGGGIVKKPIVRIGCIFHVHNPVGPGCTGRQPKNRHNDREAKILSKERTLKEMGSKRSAQAFFVTSTDMKRACYTIKGGF